MYSSLARYYDKLGFNEFAMAFLGKILPLFERYMRAHDIPKQNLKIIDLACGTGELSRLLSNNGFKACGLDVSKEMLYVARRKKPGLKFYNKDLRTFSLKSKYHVATCAFDSLNHITEESELLTVFKNVYRALRKYGLFIFDMNTIKGLTNWRSQVVKSTRDYLMIRNSGYNDNDHTAYMFIEAFIRTKGKYYDRIYDVFYEKGYPNSTIRRLLKKVGFSKVAMSCFHQFGTIQQSPRIFVVAYK